MQKIKFIRGKLLSRSLKISVALIVTLLYACSGPEADEEIVELPPSMIYADDNSTILGRYSNVKEDQFDLAPYFCASLETDLETLFSQKDAKGKYLYHKKDGSRYDIYKDELSIYTTLNPTMQQYAEEAIQKHLKEDLQPAFTENNSKGDRFPFSNSYNGKKVTRKDVERIMRFSREGSNRFQSMSNAGISEEKINESFDEITAMRIFSWQGEIDTLLTPNDSIRYAINFIQSSLLSLEPATGHVKAWVGGINFDHFPNDRVKTGRQQVGSAMKPFLYATAMSMGVIEPCTEFTDQSYCIDPCDPSGKRWCPPGSYSGTVKSSYPISSGARGVPIMSFMGACSGPQTLARLLEDMNIKVPESLITPAMCLGTPDMSLFENVAAQATFVNEGIFISPQTVLRITDRDGVEIYSAEPILKEVLNSTVAYEQLKLMKSVVQWGTATSLRGSRKWGGISYSTAGVTGTTQGNSVGWFIGLTPDLVTGILTSADDMSVRFRSMTWGQGARMSLPIYGYYMQKIYSNPALEIATTDFSQPDTYDSTYFNCDDEEHEVTLNKESNPFSF